MLRCVHLKAFKTENVNQMLWLSRINNKLNRKENLLSTMKLD